MAAQKKSGKRRPLHQKSFSVRSRDGHVMGKITLPNGVTLQSAGTTRAISEARLDEKIRAAMGPDGSILAVRPALTNEQQDAALRKIWKILIELRRRLNAYEGRGSLVGAGDDDLDVTLQKMEA